MVAPQVSQTLTDLCVYMCDGNIRNCLYYRLEGMNTDSLYMSLNGKV